MFMISFYIISKRFFLRRKESFNIRVVSINKKSPKKNIVSQETFYIDSENV